MIPAAPALLVVFHLQRHASKKRCHLLWGQDYGLASPLETGQFGLQLPGPKFRCVPAALGHAEGLGLQQARCAASDS